MQTSPSIEKTIEKSEAEIECSDSRKDKPSAFIYFGV